MTMRNWIANNFLIFVGMILLFIIYMQTCGNSVSAPAVRYDTTIVKSYYITNGDTTIVKPVVRDSVVREFNSNIVEYKDNQELIAIIKDLKEQLLKERAYSDTFKIDTIGTAVLAQTVSQNMLMSQKMRYSLKIPRIDSTITIRLPHKNIWMIGGSIEGNKNSFTRQINADLLLITKKDKGYKIGTGIDINGNVVYRFGLYWKL